MAQGFHLAPGVRHGHSDFAPDLSELLCGQTDAGEGCPQFLQFLLELVSLFQHAGEGRAHLTQFPERSDFLLHQFPLIILQAARHVEHRIKAFCFLLYRVGVGSFFTKQHIRSLLYSKTTQVMDWLTNRLL